MFDTFLFKFRCKIFRRGILDLHNTELMLARSFTILFHHAIFLFAGAEKYNTYVCIFLVAGHDQGRGEFDIVLKLSLNYNCRLMRINRICRKVLGKNYKTSAASRKIECWPVAKFVTQNREILAPQWKT